MDAVDGTEGPAGLAGAQVRVDDISSGDGLLVLAITGELDVSSVPAARIAVDEALERQPERVIFDLSALSFMDSSGIALLLRVAQRIPLVQLRSPSPIVRRIIEISGLSGTLPITE
jgi:anti-anti-sigma factor